MPHLSVPQARVLALWSYGIALTRSCGRLTVATFLALLLGQKVATVEQRLYEWCCAAPHKAGRQAADARGHDLFCPPAALGRGPVDRQLALALDATSIGGAVCGADRQCRLSGLCHPRGLDRLARQPAPSVATGMAAPAAAGAPRPSPRLDGAGAGRPGVVGALALSGALFAWAGIPCCGSTKAPSSDRLATRAGTGCASWWAASARAGAAAARPFVSSERRLDVYAGGLVGTWATPIRGFC